MIDERKGRLEAKRRGLATTGTLGVLLAEGRNGLVDAAAAYERLLTKTSFRCALDVRESFLRLLSEFDKNREQP